MFEKPFVARIGSAIGGVLMLCAASTANSTVIMDQVGTVAADGATGAALASTLSGGFTSGSFGWTHNYGPVVGTILSAMIEIDIIDPDNGVMTLHAGTTSLAPVIGSTSNTGSQGAPGPWRDLLPASPPAACNSSSGSCDNTINIAGAFFADLADGTFQVFGENVGLGIYGSNRAKLTIVTDSANGQIPEPATLALFGLGLAGLGFARRRKAA